MASYFSFGKTTITDFSEENIEKMYDQGYVFTRTGKGDMNRTRSIRIDLSKFELTSENRRVLRKTAGLDVMTSTLPLAPEEYDWNIQKIAKDFYSQKFGSGTFSANKVKKLLTDQAESNFNVLYKFKGVSEQVPFGYAICYHNSALLHYCYPFYRFMDYKRDYGMSMMLNAIVSVKCKEKKYVYLGSGTRPADKYKLQFPGIEWFDGEKWQTDVEALKKIIADSGADALIRRAQIEDAKDITDIHIKTWQTTYEKEFDKEYLDSLSTPKEFTARLERWINYFVSCQSTTLVAVHDDQIVGFSNFGKARDTANRLAGEIYSIYVLKDFQRKGVGKALLNATLEEMRTAYSYVSLLTLSTNTIAHKFFEKNSFKKMPIEIKSKVDKFDVVQLKYELPLN